MKKFIFKSALYIFIILLLLEVLVRILHLYTEDPPRTIDEFGVERRMPGANGYAVTGNRNQNFSEFHINKSGFNSRREYDPSTDKYEVALVGDSFIEGFHEDYDSSIGKRVEDKIPNIEVYEYGYAGYDFANQIYLVNAYKENFKLIDEIIYYMKFENDLERSEYEPNQARINMLSSTLFKIRDNIKLLSYGSKIGILEPFKKLAQGGKAFQKPEEGYQTNTLNDEEEAAKEKVKEKQRIDNFKSLIAQYGFDKNKTAILLDSRKTSPRFLEYLDNANIRYIDFASRFKASKKATNLIFDMHWNSHGRELVAEEIAAYILKHKQ